MRTTEMSNWEHMASRIWSEVWGMVVGDVDVPCGWRIAIIDWGGGGGEGRFAGRTCRIGITARCSQRPLSSCCWGSRADHLLVEMKRRFRGDFRGELNLREEHRWPGWGGRRQIAKAETQLAVLCLTTLYWSAASVPPLSKKHSSCWKLF